MYMYVGLNVIDLPNLKRCCRYVGDGDLWRFMDRCTSTSATLAVYAEQ